MAEKKKIGKYLVIGLLGEGGMGKVYKAVHPNLKRHVVIKQVSSRAGKAYTQRFEREAKIMLDFRQDNIVPVYDYFREGGYYYIVMEFVDGLPLDAVIQKMKRIDPQAAIVILSQICTGLKYAHEKGVIHRDIKPANILVSKKGEVKLVDFGIATSGEEEDLGLTKTGIAMGTPSYMSPEQIADAKRVDQRSDIYSLGVVLYQMVCGQKPFPGNFAAETLRKITKGQYQDPRRINRNVPRVLRKIIRKAMHHKQRRRYRDLPALMRSLDRVSVRFTGQDEIKDEIRKYLTGERTLKTRLTSPVRGSARTLLGTGITGIVTAGLAAAAFYVYTQGLYYEFIKNREYGSIRVQVELPPDYYREPEATYARAIFRRLDVEPGTDSVSSRFLKALPPDTDKSEQNEEGGSTNESREPPLLSTGTIYLPDGNYELELLLGNQKLYASFYLNPRVIQQEKLETHAYRIIKLAYPSAKPKPITFHIRIYDEQTGESLYDRANIVFQHGNSRWLDWKINAARFPDYLEKILTSGKKYSFKFAAPGYTEKTITFNMENDLDRGYLDVSLPKKPQKLIIESNTDRLKILIDNNSEGYLGEHEKKFIEYGNTMSGVKEFFLVPGNYTLTIMKNSKIFKSHQLSLSSAAPAAVRVTYDEEADAIIIE